MKKNLYHAFPPSLAEIEFAQAMLARTPANRASLRRVIDAYHLAVGSAFNAHEDRPYSMKARDAVHVAYALRAQAFVLLSLGARRCH